MKMVHARITKQDIEGNFFSWVERFECQRRLDNEIYRLETKHGKCNIGFEIITLREYLDYEAKRREWLSRDAAA